ncbi:hypothetical protein [Armatimonas sp.]|uniref:hypothetical protein n=1 Tax=Armatimonas sp. TaxID=1872638 RepID=UPI003752FC6B
MKPKLTLTYEPGWLTVSGGHLPGPLTIHYLEAYCRAGSTDADWVTHTVIPHKTEVLAQRTEGTQVRLRDTLADGVTVTHTLTAKADNIDFQLVAHNPGVQRSEAHWAQPCIRLSAFLGLDEKSASNATDYLPRCFLFFDGKQTALPTRDWATKGRYMPGQTWCPAHIPRTDVNPRPLSPLVPSNGLIGAVSGDGKWLFATAWEPYQELFQGVIRCLHSDFRLGGLLPGETKKIRGKIYLVPNNLPDLLKRYEKDFPEHTKKPRIPPRHLPSLTAGSHFGRSGTRSRTGI